MKPFHSGVRNPPVDGRRNSPTVAFFAPALGAALYYQKWQLWGGMAQVCREHGANLLYVAGGALDTDPAAVLYDLVDPGVLDGVVSWTGVVTPWLTVDRAVAFLTRHRSLPVVNVGWHLPGVPSLAFDQAQGMSDLLHHLIEVHGLRRIAYLARSANHLGFEHQYRGYEETLRRYGLFDPALVVDRTESPLLSVLDQRGLRAGQDYQAIVCTNDTPAMAVISELQLRGLRVPQDVAVTGFHDGQEARITVPPLTTVRMPWHEAGRLAAEWLLDRIADRPVPDVGLMPLEVVVRQSCGCADARTMRAGASSRVRARAPGEAADERERIAGAISKAVGAHAADLAPDWAGMLLDSFLSDLSSKGAAAPVAFLSALNTLLRQAAAGGANLNAWHDALSAMRGGCLPLLAGPEAARAEDLWQQGRVLIGQSAARSEAHQVWQLVRQAEALHRIEAELHIVTDRSGLLSALADLLPRLGIGRCRLVLYENPAQPAELARLIFALDESGPLALPPSGLTFPTTELLPKGFWPTTHPFSLAIEALHYGGEQLGFVLFEVDPRQGFELGTTYEALRSQISSALKSVQLYEEIERARRAAEAANELKSRFLSVVSHELRTPLNLIVGLCEMTSWEQARGDPADSRALLAALLDRQGQIYASAQHLDRLIRDVLDLASSQVGQLKLLCETLDVAALLQEVAAMGRHMAQDKLLAWHAEIPPRLPPVWGDRTRLRQVLLNLISNAVKFTAHGGVTLRADADDRWLVLSISDTGLGISPVEQAAIFDEFRQSERTTSRGYGGIGLGLAITRRLVELHGGTIRVASDGREGSGSTFTVRLPVHSVHEAAPPASTSPAVLVMAGQGHSPERLERYLVGRGFEVRVAPLEAAVGDLERILAAPLAAVVLDCAAECDQGWAVLRALKEHPATCEVPVLFCAVLDDQQGGGVLTMDLLPKPADAKAIARVAARYGLDPAGARQAPTVVIADDEPGIVRLHTELVQAQLPGSRVLSAENGLQALDLIRRELPDLVLLDLMMPEADGFAVLEALREGDTTRDIPVIVMTGQSLTEHDMARLSLGVAAVLGKGLFTADETLAQVDAALTRTRRPGGEGQRLVRRGMAYIHAHYAEEISRNDIARYLGVNESHLTHCFDRELGIPPMTYLNRYRIRQARKMLESAPHSITEVAMAAGFSSPSYFARVFLKEVGVTPRAYRRGERPV